MSNEAIKLSSGVSCFVCDTFISFGLKEGCVILPTVAFCSMSFNEAKRWLQLVRIDINRDDFRSIYVDGDLSLAGLLNCDLPKW